MDDFLESTASVEEETVILLPAQSKSYATDAEEDDLDVYHRNELFPNNVEGNSEEHKHSDE